MTTYEIGIPIRQNLLHARETISRAKSVLGVTSIHVSINDAKPDVDYQALRGLDPRVRVSVPSENLGLYGNLRFLARQCETEFFSWLCFDDVPSQDLLSRSLGVLSPDGKVPFLFVPTMGQRLFDEAKGGWHGPLEMWPVRPESLSGNPKGVFFGFRTHYIYGLWDSSYLKRIFPAKNFDWLDALLLSKTAASGRLAHVDTQTFVVGIVDKFPTMVGQRHRFVPWFWRSLPLAFSLTNPIGRLYWFGMAVVDIYRVNRFWNRAESESATKLARL